MMKIFKFTEIDSMYIEFNKKIFDVFCRDQSSDEVEVSIYDKNSSHTVFYMKEKEEGLYEGTIYINEEALYGVFTGDMLFMRVPKYFQDLYDDLVIYGHVHRPMYQPYWIT